MAANVPSNDNRLVWIDLEMTGLDPDTDTIIEIATLVTDQELVVLAEGPELAIRHPVERLEAMDVYSAAWFVGECGGEVATDDAEIWTIIDRFGEHTMVQQFVPLAARYTALRDMANRQHTGRLRQGRATGDSGGTAPAGA